MILPPALDSGPIAGACSEWELVLRASFDGELDAADSLGCELHLGRCQRCGETEKVEIDEAEIQAFRHRVVCSRRVAKSNWLIAPFEGAFAAGVGGKGRERAFQAEGIDCFRS